MSRNYEHYNGVAPAARGFLLMLILFAIALGMAALSLTGCDDPIPIGKEPTSELSDILVDYTRESVLITRTTPINDVKDALTVTAYYLNGTTKTVAKADYKLSGELTEGWCTLTVAYQGKTKEVSVYVTCVCEGAEDCYCGANCHCSNCYVYITPISRINVTVVAPVYGGTPHFSAK